MRWLKRDPLNGIAIGILLFLVLIPWILIQVEDHTSTGLSVRFLTEKYYVPYN